MQLFDDWPDDFLRGVHHYDTDNNALQKPAQDESAEGISSGEREAPNG